LSIDWIGAVLIALAPIEVYVAYRYVRAARERPPIDFLTASALRETTSAIGGVLLAVIGLSSVWRAITGHLLLPPGFGLLLLVAAMLLFSVGAFAKLVYIRRWDRQDRTSRLRREGDS
jgi:hypothetical protein